MSISLPNEDIAQAPNPGQASTTNLQKEQTVPRNVDTHPAASKPSMEAVYMDRVRKVRPSLQHSLCKPSMLMCVGTVALVVALQQSLGVTNASVPINLLCIIRRS